MISRLPSFLRRLRDDNSGAALIELVLVVPLLSTLTLGTVDYSLMVTANLSVQGAARAGADYAVLHGYSSNAIASAVTNSPTRGMYLSAITANPAPTQWYGCSNTTTGVTVKTSSTAVCTNGLTAGTYVTVSSQANYTYILPWPYVSSPATLASSVTVRIN